MSEIVPAASQAPALLRPIAKPADFIAVHTETAGLIRDALEEGRDYGKIPGTAKNTLLKPGAERLSLAFGLRSAFEILSSEIDHDRENKTRNGVSYGLYRYAVRCMVYGPDGREVGQGIGSCSSLESKYISRPRDSENTVLKMAKKRALVDAVLSTLGLSDRFTQDVEDIRANDEAAVQTTAPQATAAEGETARKATFATLGEKGIKYEGIDAKRAVRAFLSGYRGAPEGGYASVSDLTPDAWVDRAAKICAWADGKCRIGVLDTYLAQQGTLDAEFTEVADPKGSSVPSAASDGSPSSQATAATSAATAGTPTSTDDAVSEQIGTYVRHEVAKNAFGYVATQWPGAKAFTEDSPARMLQGVADKAAERRLDPAEVPVVRRLVLAAYGLEDDGRRAGTALFLDWLTNARDGALDAASAAAEAEGAETL